MKEIINTEKKIYEPWNICKTWIERFQKNERCVIFKYIKFLRLEEYCFQKGFAYKILRVYYTRRKNSLGNKIGIKIVPNYVGVGVNIHHKDIIINGNVGHNCTFHGNNCIGNNSMGGGTALSLPIIGDNVDLGYGACVIGSVRIANNVKIGAGAVVVKDILEENTVWAGVPARKLY